jgi:hypothetical protein
MAGADTTEPGHLTVMVACEQYLSNSREGAISMEFLQQLDVVKNQVLKQEPRLRIMPSLSDTHVPN